MVALAGQDLQASSPLFRDGIILTTELFGLKETSYWITSVFMHTFAE
jgi:hypothetical protein